MNFDDPKGMTPFKCKQETYESVVAPALRSGIPGWDLMTKREIWEQVEELNYGLEMEDEVDEDVQRAAFKVLLKQIGEIGDDVIRIDKTQKALVSNIGTDPGISDFRFLSVW